MRYEYVLCLRSHSREWRRRHVGLSTIWRPLGHLGTVPAVAPKDKSPLLHLWLRPPPSTPKHPVPTAGWWAKSSRVVAPTKGLPRELLEPPFEPRGWRKSGWCLAPWGERLRDPPWLLGMQSADVAEDFKKIEGFQKKKRRNYSWYKKIIIKKKKKKK